VVNRNKRSDSRTTHICQTAIFGHSLCETPGAVLRDRQTLAEPEWFVDGSKEPRGVWAFYGMRWYAACAREVFGGPGNLQMFCRPAARLRRLESHVPSSSSPRLERRRK